MRRQMALSTVMSTAINAAIRDLPAEVLDALLDAALRRAHGLTLADARRWCWAQRMANRQLRNEGNPDGNEP